MRAYLLILSSLVLWTLYDPALVRRRSFSVGFAAISQSLEDLEGKEQKQKKIRRRERRVRPGWMRGRKRVVTKCNYFSTKPRDPRFSNQRKIRRMFNNM